MQNTLSTNDIKTYESTASAVSWPAIIAGAVTAAAVSLALLVLGSGLGFATMSPWRPNATLTTISVATVIWLIIMQWLASGLGGYITGRLRTKWSGTHTDEVFFRDTAHGFLTWALATVITVALLSSTAASVAGGGLKAAGTGIAVQQAASPNHTAADPNMYFIDSLFRTDHAATAPSDQDMRAETSRILLNGAKNEGVPDADKAYLARLVSARTGLSQDDAAKRVDDVLAQEAAAEQKLRQKADAARKTAATLSIFTFLSLLVGAFIASVTAAMGGKNRDEY
jgi:hypothetical protein